MNIQAFQSCPPVLPPPKWIEHDDVRISWDVPVAFVQGKPMQLDRRGFALLYYLMANRGRTLTRQQLLDHVWGVDSKSLDDNTINVYVSRVRDELAKHGRVYLLKTVRGRGYCFGGEI